MAAFTLANITIITVTVFTLTTVVFFCGEMGRFIPHRERNY